MKKTCFFALAIFFAVSFAQPRFEYDIHYGFGSSETGLNNVAGIAAAVYPFTNNFGFSVGLEYSSKEKKRLRSILEGSQNMRDNEGDSLVFKYRFYGHEEIRTATVLQIPILLRYTHETYYVSGGLKIGIPQAVEAKTRYSALAVEGYYPEMDYTFDDLRFQGFGRYGSGAMKTTFESEVLYMLAFEYGAKIEMTDKTALMLGVFVERALNDGFNKDFSPRVERDEMGTMGGWHLNESWKTWNPWTIGVQFKISFMH